MTNWQFFKKNNSYSLKYFKRPSLATPETNEGDKHLRDNPEAVGYYDAEKHRIVLIKKYNNIAVRLHEYGHWLNALIYIIMEVAWEFIWWGCSVRSIFIKKDIADESH